MRIGDLKRAVEDVILRPDDNRLSDITKRSTIAALDLCQRSQVGSLGAPGDVHADTVVLTSFSCSGDMLSSPTGSTCSTSVTTSSGPTHSELPLSMSTSLDTMVLRQSLSCRPSLGTSRRSSRVLPHYVHSKRKRSNSVSSCNNKGMHDQHAALSSMGVGRLCVGGASALSLPPTARHTPLRFGDSDDRPVATSSGGPPITSISDPLDASVSVPSTFAAAGSQWPPAMSVDYECAFDDGALLQRYDGTFSVSEDAMLRARSSTDANYSTHTHTFNSFRISQNAFCDSDDNDERMECD